MHVPCSYLSPQTNQVWYPYLFCSLRISCIHVIKYHICFLFPLPIPSISPLHVSSCNFFPFLFFLFFLFLLPPPPPFFSFCYLTKANQCCPYVHRCETIHCSMGNLPVATPSEKNARPQQQTSANSSLARGRPGDHTSSVLEFWLAWSHRVNHSCSEFMSVMVVPCPDDCLPALALFLPFLKCSLSLGSDCSQHLDMLCVFDQPLLTVDKMSKLSGILILFLLLTGMERKSVANLNWPLRRTVKSTSGLTGRVPM